VSDFKIIMIFMSIALFPLLLSGKTWDSDSLVSRINENETKLNDRWVAPDKGLHLVGSAILMIGSAKSLQRFAGYGRSRSMNWSFGFTFSLGIGKEIYDRTRPGNLFSYKDLTADILGCCIGCILVNME
jgi:uncharacterized protein YfiM (DUF2279 family)